METPIQQSESRTPIVDGVKRWEVQMIVSFLIFGTLLFLLAGTLDWIARWMHTVGRSNATA